MVPIDVASVAAGVQVAKTMVDLLREINWKKTTEKTVEIITRAGQLVRRGGAAVGLCRAGVYDVVLHSYPEDLQPESLFTILERFHDPQGPLCKSYRITKPLQGMVAPLTLCQGNVHDIARDWPKVIKDYTRGCTQGFAPLPHCYNTLWRMWGPSLEHFLENERYEVFQLGYGDENNSLPFVLSTEVIENNGLRENLVTPVSTTGTLISLRDPKLRAKLGERVVGKLADRFSVVLIAGEDLHGELFGEKAVSDPAFGNKKRNDFYSAYIWAKVCHREFGDCLIFEHGNIANENLVDEYTDLLAVKIKYLADKYGRDNLTVEDYFLSRMEAGLKAGTRLAVRREREAPPTS